jgi:hypothetical protein
LARIDHALAMQRQTIGVFVKAAFSSA